MSILSSLKFCVTEHSGLMVFCLLVYQSSIYSKFVDSTYIEGHRHFIDLGKFADVL